MVILNTEFAAESSLTWYLVSNSNRLLGIGYTAMLAYGLYTQCVTNYFRPETLSATPVGLTAGLVLGATLDFLVQVRRFVSCTVECVALTRSLNRIGYFDVKVSTAQDVFDREHV